MRKHGNTLFYVFSLFSPFWPFFTSPPAQYVVRKLNCQKSHKLKSGIFLKSGKFSKKWDFPKKWEISLKQWDFLKTVGTSAPGPVPRGGSTDRPCARTTIPRVPTPVPLAATSGYTGTPRRLRGWQRSTRLHWDTVYDPTYHLLQNHHFILLRNGPVKVDCFRHFDRLRVQEYPVLPFLAILAKITVLWHFSGTPLFYVVFTICGSVRFSHAF